jgi:hypothetical protein
VRVDFTKLSVEHKVGGLLKLTGLYICNAPVETSQKILYIYIHTFRRVFSARMLFIFHFKDPASNFEFSFLAQYFALQLACMTAIKDLCRVAQVRRVSYCNMYVLRH